MSVQKRYIKSRPVCKVKFELPKDLINGAKRVNVVGEFNDWDENANQLKKQKNGNYSTTIDLNTGAEYQFRYLIDGERWENDPAADRYVPNNICSAENSVVVV